MKFIVHCDVPDTLDGPQTPVVIRLTLEEGESEARFLQITTNTIMLHDR